MSPGWEVRKEAVVRAKVASRLASLLNVGNWAVFMKGGEGNGSGASWGHHEQSHN